MTAGEMADLELGLPEINVYNVLLFSFPATIFFPRYSATLSLLSHLFACLLENLKKKKNLRSIFTVKNQVYTLSRNSFRVAGWR